MFSFFPQSTRAFPLCLSCDEGFLLKNNLLICFIYILHVPIYNRINIDIEKEKKTSTNYFYLNLIRKYHYCASQCLIHLYLSTCEVVKTWPHCVLYYARPSPIYKFSSKLEQ